MTDKLLLFHTTKSPSIFENNRVKQKITVPPHTQKYLIDKTDRSGKLNLLSITTPNRELRCLITKDVYSTNVNTNELFDKGNIAFQYDELFLQLYNDECIPEIYIMKYLNKHNFFRNLFKISLFNPTDSPITVEYEIDYSLLKLGVSIEGIV